MKDGEKKFELTRANVLQKLTRWDLRPGLEFVAKGNGKVAYKILLNNGVLRIQKVSSGEVIETSWERVMGKIAYLREPKE